MIATVAKTNQVAGKIIDLSQRQHVCGERLNLFGGEVVISRHDGSRRYGARVCEMKLVPSDVVADPRSGGDVREIHSLALRAPEDGGLMIEVAGNGFRADVASLAHHPAVRFRLANLLRVAIVATLA